MSPQICLPSETVKLIGKVENKARHPGLELDKYCALPSEEHEWGKWQESQGKVLERVTELRGDAALLDTLLQDRRRMLQALNPRCWTGTTQGPLTLHLARAGALENAGICLHPLYGFAWIPGSGLKGMTRAFAETLTDAPDDERKRLFGWSPDGKETDGAAGSVVFHDAWPTRWPNLVRDLSNSHHAKYYTGKQPAPPADYEEPVPISFLSVQSGTEFEFALSKRSPATSDADLELAQRWLTGALTHLGVGAKTAAGYGTVICADQPAAPVAARRRETFEVELRLVTPAFLAGAQQRAEDCDLRVPTLRGQLRWWWRTMHAGHVDSETLRMMEAAVWGDTSQGSPVRLTLERKTRRPPLNYSYADLQRSEGLPARSPITLMGLHYVSFGMDDPKKDEPKGEKSRQQRYYLPPGASWLLKVVVRDQPPLTDKEGKVLRPGVPAQVIREQVECALWLLTQFGGVGAKSRKGFGSFADLPELQHLTDELRRQRGQALRHLLKVRESTEGVPDTARLKGARLEAGAELRTKLRANDDADVWFALDSLGTALQHFVSLRKAEDSNRWRQLKAGLGLPRGKEVESVRRHNKAVSRWAAPYCCHWAVTDGGYLQLRVMAFPVPLPDAKSNEELMPRLVEHFKKSLQQQTNRPRPPRDPRAATVQPPQSTLRPRPPMGGGSPPRRDNYGNRGPRR